MKLRRLTSLALAALLAVAACSKEDSASAPQTAAGPSTDEEASKSEPAGSAAFYRGGSGEQAAATLAAPEERWSEAEAKRDEAPDPEPMVDMPAAAPATEVTVDNLLVPSRERDGDGYLDGKDSMDSTGGVKGERFAAKSQQPPRDSLVDGVRGDDQRRQGMYETVLGKEGKKSKEKRLDMPQEGENSLKVDDSEERAELEEEVAQLDDDEREKATKKPEAPRPVDDKRRSNRQSGPDLAELRPDSFLPRMLYFENTYLGGDAAYLENLRRVTDAMGGDAAPHLLARAYPQPFDPPADAGLALHADLDTRWIERPGRVILQVGLRGSERYGWRRPPLEIVLVVDPAVIPQSTEPAVAVASELLNQLGPQDRLAVVIAGDEPLTLAPLGHVRTQRGVLATALDRLERPRASSYALAQGMRRAGELLEAASIDRSTLPGTQTVLVLTSGTATDRVPDATSAAHALTVMGVVTSVIEANPAEEGAFWAVANAGYGNYHRTVEGDVREAVHDELESLSRVVARLVRVNIRLAKGAHAIRILGSRVLDAAEVERVKAREVAADRNISRTMGVAADRGEDDDGIQTVIPYFYGGDSHVILVELWVDEPGAVADVTVRYKDMVRLDNATARATVTLRNVRRDETAEQRLVSLNARGLSIGESLEHAAIHVRRGELGEAMSFMARARETAETTTPLDARAVAQLEQLVAQGNWVYDTEARSTLAAALTLAGRRKVGEPAPASAAAASQDL